MNWLTERRLQSEIMDQPGLDSARHESALRGLARLNFFSGSARILWPPLSKRARADGPLRILDLATGAGDVPLRLWQRGRRAGVTLELEGCDRSPTAVAHAADRAKSAGAPLRFFTLDIEKDPLPVGYDVLMCSLFLHHLDEETACDLLRRMARAARRAVLVNDLDRRVGGLALAHVATRLLTTSSIVHTDGPRSVEAAFTVAEVRKLADRAGMPGAIVVRRWPFRWLMEWNRE